jgi:hypothetical protein
MHCELEFLGKKANRILTLLSLFSFALVFGFAAFFFTTVLLAEELVTVVPA